MEKYLVYYKDVVIGYLTVKDGTYKYDVDSKGLELIGKKNIFDSLRESTKGFVKSIPFFEARFSNSARFAESVGISYHTDNYTIKKETPN